jgi:hypothetical protein
MRSREGRRFITLLIGAASQPKPTPAPNVTVRTITFLTNDLQTYVSFFSLMTVIYFPSEQPTCMRPCDFWPVIVGKSTVKEAVRPIDITRQGPNQEASSICYTTSG